MIKNPNVLAILHNDILKLTKNFYEKLYTEETISKTATAELSSTICNRRKSQMNNFTFLRLKSLYNKIYIYKFSN